ncbi:MAG: glycosyltransferase [Alteraurantiacibacter sp.]
MASGNWVDRFEEIAPTLVIGRYRVEDEQVDELRARLVDFLQEQPAFTFINSVASGDYCKIDPYNAPRFAYVHELKKVIDAFSAQTDNLRNGVNHAFCDGEPVLNALRDHAGFPEEILSNRESFIELSDTTTFLDAGAKRTLRGKMGWDPETRIVMGCGVVHWRKQPDTFVRAAAAIPGDVKFVWIGDGEDLDKMRNLARDLDVSDRVEFLGYRDDYRDLLSCADLFALSSVEDPFPLVCLEAGAVGVPSVIFREAGGMISFVAPDGEEPAGRAVPLGDEAAFFAALYELLNDEALRERMARTGFDRVQDRHSSDRACMGLLGDIRRIADLKPKVSILVPVYNSAAYLRDRLDSIAAQTFRDVEIILRDDASSDDSVAMLEAFVRRHPFSRLEIASKNSGSVFNAWSKCIDEAQGELIWLAEADDTCDENFLERVVAAFEPSGVRLVHGRSVPMDAEGKVTGDYRQTYLTDIAPGRWNHSHCNPARREIDAALGRGNVIPNASGVVVRRDAARRAIAVAREFRLAGDWAFYVVAIHGGRIGYVADAVNYHRRHDTTVTKSLEGSALYFRELANVNALVRHLYGADPVRDRSFRKKMEAEANRFGWTDPLPEGRVPEAAAGLGQHPGLLFGVGDLSGGGAQMFAVRLMNGWAKSGAPAVLFLAGHEAEHPAVRGALSPEVAVIGVDEIRKVGLGRFMADWGLDTVATGHWWADREVAALLDRDVGDASAIPWTIVMHGCYENVLDEPDAFPDRSAVFEQAERHCDRWIWTADKNRRLFDEGHVSPKSVGHIVNGFEPVAPGGLNRETLGIPHDALVFTLASRAIEQKGWFAARDAFRLLTSDVGGGRDLRLVLIGDGPAAQEIASDGLDNGIHLVAHTSQLADYIALSDVGLLPSWFAGESLPLVLLEFLAQGKPSIVSDIGMCAWIIDAELGADAAGIVVPRTGGSGTIDAIQLSAAMKRFVDDPELAGAKRQAAERAFEKFDFEKMLVSYRKNFADIKAKPEGFERLQKSTGSG